MSPPELAELRYNSQDRRLRIVLLVRSLERGGAQRQLVALAGGLSARGHVVTTVPFYTDGPLVRPLREAGLRCMPLDKRGRWDLASFASRFVRLLRDQRPDVVYSFLVDANLAGLISKVVGPQTKLVWSIRASNMDLSHYGHLSRLVFFLTRPASRGADLIISNSVAGRQFHASLGYPAGRIRVVPNGIDTVCFAPDRDSGLRLRRGWGVEDDDVLVGVVARLDPMKDHPTFLNAASRLARRRPQVRYVCVGGGPADYARALEVRATELGIRDRIVWAGEVGDMPTVYNAVDVLCLPSRFGEGFPNVVGEAMACGVPCVATDVGDSRRIIGDAGLVVQPGNPVALAHAIDTLAGELPHNRASLAARSRAAISPFSVERMIDETARLLESL